MVRRYDPERRQRLIDAAIRVVGERGIGGLSHRAVAAEADVPLGSTTYHFSTLDDLLVAALHQVNERFMLEITSWEALVGPEDDFADALARLVEELLTRDRSRIELEYELYLAALRRPAVRPIAAEWVDLMADILALRTDRGTAQALAALIDGMSLQALLTGRAFDREQARRMFDRILMDPR
ncbi:MAG: TetR/AcrR family transcriptional regulator, regulator of biofilm formation and stress response [Streptomycetaceae bacterium]|nr:TetR/AcrR family transcriptional regulator, regulator of biofilm formation and stress response [Streptomycetaceae bacterium]